MANENSIDIHYSSYSIGSKFDVIRHALTFGADEIEEYMSDLGFKKKEGGYLVTAEGIAPHLNKSTDETQDILEELHAEAVYPDWQKANGREQ